MNYKKISRISDSEEKLSTQQISSEWNKLVEKSKSGKNNDLSARQLIARVNKERAKELAGYKLVWNGKSLSEKKGSKSFSLEIDLKHETTDIDWKDIFDGSYREVEDSTRVKDGSETFSVIYIDKFHDSDDFAIESFTDWGSAQDFADNLGAGEALVYNNKNSAIIEKLIKNEKSNL